VRSVVSGCLSLLFNLNLFIFENPSKIMITELVFKVTRQFIRWYCAIRNKIIRAWFASEYMGSLCLIFHKFTESKLDNKIHKTIKSFLHSLNTCKEIQMEIGWEKCSFALNLGKNVHYSVLCDSVLYFSIGYVFVSSGLNSLALFDLFINLYLELYS